ncbi:MAG: biotin/lipoyl-binding protein [Hyphomicrobiales bacterium]
MESEARVSWLAGVARRPWFKVAFAIVVIIGATAAGSFIYLSRPIAIQVATIEENVSVRVFGLSTVEARVLSKIGFEVGATLAELNVDHGDHVTNGQVLARLNIGEQEAKVAKARAALIVAEANIKKGEANLEKTQAVLAQKQTAIHFFDTAGGRLRQDLMTASECQVSFGPDA